jgi:hypothetical protein
MEDFHDFFMSRSLSFKVETGAQAIDIEVLAWRLARRLAWQ